MVFFDLFRKTEKEEEKSYLTTDEGVEMIESTGDNFEFLIKGDIDIPNEKFDKIMVPISLICRKVEKDNWIYYQIGNDEFSYSFEPPGIQMTFNKEITFNKAKQIADEVLNNIRSTGQEAELVILSSGNIYKF
ncbi:hypothetical protein [Mucilaginibacter xinganensis]|uniref:Uncharacterized protein n=1 Tax=Mucilaginibacter xinganensis TaxID=1234841 RepID=A0A223NRE3_9SPHI|nr:hypothetical protein [Mucilaginibacter xinganensis]ASU32274.1 hypothetical protein MuYL_0371 [Mucilaginibacter xinganensis]